MSIEYLMSIVKKSGISNYPFDFEMVSLDDLKLFSELVAEECAKVCDELSGSLLAHLDMDGAEIAVAARDAIRAKFKVAT